MTNMFRLFFCFEQLRWITEYSRMKLFESSGLMNDDRCYWCYRCCISIILSKEILILSGYYSIIFALSVHLHYIIRFFNFSVTRIIMIHSKKMHESKTPVLKRCLKMGQTIFKFEWQLLELKKLKSLDLIYLLIQE